MLLVQRDIILSNTVENINKELLLNAFRIRRFWNNIFSNVQNTKGNAPLLKSIYHRSILQA